MTPRSHVGGLHRSENHSRRPLEQSHPLSETAISVPDDPLERASRRAKQLGVSRSEFFATAAMRYLAELDRESLTARIDQGLALVGEEADTSEVTEGVLA